MDPNKVFMALDDVVVLTLNSGNVTSKSYDSFDLYLAS